MTSYIILPNGNDSSFNVGITGADGTRQTLLGFESEEAAEAWIIRDKRLSRASDPAAHPDTSGASGD